MKEIYEIHNPTANADFVFLKHRHIDCVIAVIYFTALSPVNIKECKWLNS